MAASGDVEIGSSSGSDVELVDDQLRHYARQRHCSSSSSIQGVVADQSSRVIRDVSLTGRRLSTRGFTAAGPPVTFTI